MAIVHKAHSVIGGKMQFVKVEVASTLLSAATPTTTRDAVCSALASHAEPMITGDGYVTTVGSAILFVVPGTANLALFTAEVQAITGMGAATVRVTDTLVG